MRTASFGFVSLAVLAAGIAAAGESSPPPAKPSPPPERALLDAAKKIPHQATVAEVKRATSALGPAVTVQYSRCKAGSGACSEASEAAATSRMDVWMAPPTTGEFALIVTSCRTEAGWKAGRVSVRSQPRKAVPGTPPAQPLHDDIDAAFFRATCWK